ncbi:hypothetical protein ACQZV8_03065 [Magnetococcales bacterium HHB-1]
MIIKRADITRRERAAQIMAIGPEHPDYEQAWTTMAKSNDPAIKHALREALEHLCGPMPKPTGYSEEGEPYWQTDVIADYLNIEESFVQDVAEEVLEEWEDTSGVKPVRELHLLQ